MSKILGWAITLIWYGGMLYPLAIAVKSRVIQARHQSRQKLQAHSITVEESDSGGYQVVE
ncbi:MAG: hypothetical protein JO316_10800 [Abitibacteriaceae bacterium]|nr:hypothetical protein [Abditibacteriaceae bacterium]